MSQIVYIASMLDIPNQYIPVIQSLLFQFLWKNKPDKSRDKSYIKTVVMVDYGLPMLNYV